MTDVVVAHPNDTDDNNSNNSTENYEYIQTTMTQNYVSRNAFIAPQISKVLEIKGRSIIHGNVQFIMLRDDRENKIMIPNNNSSSEPEYELIIPIRIGRYCHIQSNTRIVQQLQHQQKRFYGVDDKDTDTRTPEQLRTKSSNMISIGSYTTIGSDCTMNCYVPFNKIYIGCNCLIGNNVTIESNVTIFDNCIVEPYTYIPPNTTIPPFTRCYNNNYKNSNEQKQLSKKEDRRHIYLYTESIPPSVTSIVQERAVTAYDTFVIQYNLQK